MYDPSCSLATLNYDTPSLKILRGLMRLTMCLTFVNLIRSDLIYKRATSFANSFSNFVFIQRVDNY